LIVSASPILATGMGEVIRLIFGTLLDQYPGEYELHQVALFHSIPVAEPRWPVYPTRSIFGQKGEKLFGIDDVDGQITFHKVAARVRPDIVFVFNDPQRVLHLCQPPQNRRHKLILYINLDGFPYPPGQGPILNRADRIFTMSKFARRVVRSCLPAIEPLKVDYMYSPADIDRFRPLPESEKLALRAKLLPEWMPKNAFILGWVGRSQWRKQVWVPYQVIGHLRRGDYLLCGSCGRVAIPQTRFSAKTRFLGGQHAMAVTGFPKTHFCCHCRSPSVDFAAPLPDVFLWLHMPDEPSLQDWSRPVLEGFSKVSAQGDIHYTEGFGVHRAEGFKVGDFKTPDEMPLIYQLFDCLLYASGGEGFGLPPWEAMCVGVPVVYTNYSSHAEYLLEADAGYPIGGILQPEPRTCIWRMIGDTSQAIEAVRKLYADRSLGKNLSTKGRSFVQQFAPTEQVARWHNVFQDMLGFPNNHPREEITNCVSNQLIV